jgi:hypothetical protein
MVVESLYPAVGTSDLSILAWRQEVDLAWRDDVALEIWIDATADVVGIRLEGALDEVTGTNLSRVIDECLSEGGTEFALDTRRARISRAGMAVMDRLDRKIGLAGGHLHWDCFAVA